MREVVSGIVTFVPSKDAAGNINSKVVIDLQTKGQIAGWIRTDGFYVSLSDGQIVRLSAAQLMDICDQIDLIKLENMDFEFDKERVDR